MTAATGFVLLGYGPSATGSNSGWRMRADLFAMCPQCGDMVSLDPDITGTCSCGRLFKAADAGRFGSDLGDDSIAIYRAR